MKNLIYQLMAVIMLFILPGCESSFSPIEIENISEAKVWTHTSSKGLSEDEITEFVRLYNQSSYGGEATGGGGTPAFGILVDFVEGDKYISVNNFGSANDFGDYLEIVGTGTQFHLRNKELYEFIKRLANEINAAS